MVKNRLYDSLILAALCTLFAMPVLAEDGAVTQHKEDIHAIPESASAVTYNVGLASDYLYRGISQTAAKPALQGGVDYAHSSGFYLGAWASTISWIKDSGIATSAPLELDIYGGYKAAAGDVAYDVGFLRYNYPGSYVAGATKADTNEIYGAVTYSIVTAKLSYCLGDLFGVSKASGSTYIDLSASYPVTDTGVTVGLHYGKQTYKGATADALDAAGFGATYADYKLSATKDFSGYLAGLALSKTDAKSGGFYTSLQGKDLGKGTAVLSVTRTF